MTRIGTLCCSIPRENAPRNEASPSVINNSGHVRGLEGSSYISSTTFQISKLFLDVNERPALKRVATSMTRKLQTNTLPFYHPGHREYGAEYHTDELCLES